MHRLAPVGDRMASSPIKCGQSLVSKQASDIGAFRIDPAGSTFLHRPEQLIVDGSNCAQEGKETEHALSNPEFIGLDDLHGGRNLHCRPTSASFACRTLTTAIRSRRSRCGDSFFAEGVRSGSSTWPDAAPQPAPIDALVPNSALRGPILRPILQNHAERPLEYERKFMNLILLFIISMLRPLRSGAP